MRIIEIRKPFEAKCPICHKVFQEWYCPLCGLPILIKPGLKTARPEFKAFNEYHLCDKCDTSNPYNARYCRNCGEKISFLHAKDKNGHGWIDLGLSVLWSTETLKGYYYWMDIREYLSYRDHNYKTAEQDTASFQWGDKWRMPTKKEFEELIEKCQWERVINLDTQKRVSSPEIGLL